MFQPEAEMVRVEGDRPRDIRHLIAHAVHAEDARCLVHHALLRLFRREPPLSYSTAISSSRRRAESPMTSTRVTLAFATVKVNARDSLPRGARINPTDPLMSAVCTNRSPRESAINCAAHVEAPVSSRALPTSAAGASMRTTPSKRARGIDANDRVRIEHREET